MGEALADGTKLAESIRNWYAPSTIDYLKRAGVDWVWLTWSVGLDSREEGKVSSQVREYIHRCRLQRIRVMGIVSAGQLILSPDLANTTKRTLKSPQGIPLPCQGQNPSTHPSVACYQANLDEPEWQKEVVTQSIKAVDAGADGVILDRISATAQDKGNLTRFVRDMSQRIKSSRPDALVVPLLPTDILEAVPQSPMLAIEDGTWPEVRPTSVILEGGQVMIAGASQGPWIDQNLWLFNYAASISHRRPILLSLHRNYTEDRASALRSGCRSLVMAEAAVFGGSWSLDLDDWLRLGLVERDPMALQEWETLIKFQDFLTGHSEYFLLPPLVNVAVVVEDIAQSSEILNLLARRGVQYNVLKKTDLSSVPLGAYNLVTGVNLTPFLPAEIQMLSNYVRAGGHAVVNPPNSPEIECSPSAQQSKDTDDYRDCQWGKGKWRLYGKPISDPDQFSKDVRAAVSFNDRWVRIWNAPTVLARTAQTTASTQRIVHLVNYGIEPIEELQIQVKGHFKRVQVLRPQDSSTGFSNGPVVTPVRKDGFTEFILPRLGIYALLVLDPDAP